MSKADAAFGRANLAVEISDLSKTYPARGKIAAKRALDTVSLRIARGRVFGLLGPNGAGKSTLINIMAGLVVKSTGHVAICGHDIDRDARRARASIGVVPQELNIDPFFTPRALLDLQAGLYGLAPSRARSQRILEAVGLADKAESYARTLSGGMRRRLMVAKAMVHNPPVLVLDEPTAGVDIELRQQLWAYVRQLNRAGTTVLLTTHYLEEAEELCDEIAIIAQGQVLACDTTPALLSRVDGKSIAVTLERPLAALPEHAAALGAVMTGAQELTLSYRRGEGRIGALLAALAEAGIAIRDVSTEETRLEDVFLQVVRGRSDAAA